jgi:TATA-box binding protein (TBP) (component of TFIID and TFIIIB)
MTDTMIDRQLPKYDNIKPTPIKVSTMTATAELSCTEINAEKLFESISIANDKEDGFLYVEYGLKNSTTFYKGYHRKLSVTKRKRKETKRFDNQVTILLRLRSQSGMSTVNMKVFCNGKIQMTGIKTITHGEHALSYLVEHIKTSSLDICKNQAELQSSGYDIRLINSDFSVNFKIKREVLDRIMRTEYQTYCSFESCTYPGVKIQYNYNEAFNNNVSGLCTCTQRCNGKGIGFGDGQCKKVTIAVFQSGCIIITGARSHNQIQAAYNYICSVIDRHYTLIHKIPVESNKLLSTM